MNETTILLARHKLDVHAFLRMGETGILAERERVELVDGEIIDMAPISQDHAGTVDWLAKALFEACGNRAIVRVQGPLRLDRFNELQPDFAILKPRDDFYRTAHPGPGDVLLLIEVANTSLRYDREVKLPLYARFGIVEYWLMDLAAREMQVHRRPTGAGYAEATTKRAGERIALTIDPVIAITLDGAFGP